MRKKQRKAELLEEVKAATRKPKSPATVVRQLNAAIRWETWAAMTLNNINPWSAEALTKGNEPSHYISQCTRWNAACTLMENWKMSRSVVL